MRLNSKVEYLSVVWNRLRYIAYAFLLICTASRQSGAEWLEKVPMELNVFYNSIYDTLALRRRADSLFTPVQEEETPSGVLYSKKDLVPPLRSISEKFAISYDGQEYYVPALVRFSGDIEELILLGLTSVGWHGKYVNVIIPLSLLPDIVSLHSVEYVFPSPKVELQLDESVPDISGDSVHQTLGFTGERVFDVRTWVEDNYDEMVIDTSGAEPMVRADIFLTSSCPELEQLGVIIRSPRGTKVSADIPVRILPELVELECVASWLPYQRVEYLRVDKEGIAEFQRQHMSRGALSGTVNLAQLPEATYLLCRLLRVPDSSGSNGTIGDFQGIYEREARSDADGRIVAENVEPGTYDLVAFLYDANTHQVVQGGRADLLTICREFRVKGFRIQAGMVSLFQLDYRTENTGDSLLAGARIDSCSYQWEERFE